MTLTANSATRSPAAYDSALDAMLRWHPDLLDHAGALTDEHPGFALGHALGAYLSLVSTDPVALPGAQESAALLAQTADDERARAHLAAVEAWVGGNWHGAAAILDELLVRWPTDILALVVGHYLDFFRGDAQNLRDRVARSLAAFDADDPHHGFVAGMYAFGLEESGHYEQAEAAGCYAVECHPEDVWAVHAVAHTYEMRGRVDDGIRFLRDREQDWGSGNFLAVHNWWHLALYLLEAGRPAEALAIYDARIHHGGSEGVVLELVDASALLWRLHLDERSEMSRGTVRSEMSRGTVDISGRWASLADAWVDHGCDRSWYAFNDLHAVMALCGAGRLGEARAIVRRLAGEAASPDEPTRSNRAMTVDVGLPASRAVIAYTEGRHRDALDELLPVRRHLARFGGSHAQRDVLQRTVVESAIAVGEHDLASALLRERLSLRESSVYARIRQARLARATGDSAAARQAEHDALLRQRRFAAAL